MEFKDFVQLLFPVIGTGNSTSAFTRTLFEIIVTDVGADIISDLKDSTYKAYYNGANKITKTARKIAPYLEPTEFESYIEAFQDSTTQMLSDSFIPHISDITPYNVSEKLSHLFISIIKDAASTTRSSTKATTLTKSVLASGQALAVAWENTVAGLMNSTNNNSQKVATCVVPIIPTRYSDGTIYIGNNTIKLPIQLVPKESIGIEEIPYINALCEVYSEKLNQIIDPDSLETLPPPYAKHLHNQ